MFFDDHQDAYQRLQQYFWWGYRRLIFEDNYPVGFGDCYSLKQGFEQDYVRIKHREVKTLSWRDRLSNFLTGPLASRKAAIDTSFHKAQMRRRLSTYQEFPPLFRPSHTRWGVPWDLEQFPTWPSVFNPDRGSELPELWEDAVHYTWICFVELAFSVSA